MSRLKVAARIVAGSMLFSVAAVLPATADPANAPSPAPSPAATDAGGGDPCLQLSNLVSRPSFSTAACVVKPNALLVQTGYANLTSAGGADASSTVTYPQENLSVGIARGVEFDLVPPSIARVSGRAPAHGITDGAIGAKVQIGQTSKFTYGANALYTLQSGTMPFTGSGDGILANLNGSYALSPAAGLFASFGYNEQSAGTPEQPARLHDVQPSLGASLALPQSFTIYAEGFNESATGPGTGGLFGFDTGLQKDIGTRLQFDAEVFDYPGTHASVHQHAVGFGAAYLLGP